MDIGEWPLSNPSGNPPALGFPTTPLNWTKTLVIASFVVSQRYTATSPSHVVHFLLFNGFIRKLRMKPRLDIWRWFWYGWKVLLPVKIVILNPSSKTIYDQNPYYKGW